MKLGERIRIPVVEIEFVVGGNTIWIHNADAATVLRLQAPPGCKILVNEECENICSHVDLQAKGDINVCLNQNG